MDSLDYQGIGNQSARGKLRQQTAVFASIQAKVQRPWPSARRTGGRVPAIVLVRPCPITVSGSSCPSMKYSTLFFGVGMRPCLAYPAVLISLPRPFRPHVACATMLLQISIVHHARSRISRTLIALRHLG
jgi:hypothetical protein